MAKKSPGYSLVMMSLQERHILHWIFFSKASCKSCTLEHLGLHSDQDSNGNKNVEQKSNSAHNIFWGADLNLIKDKMKWPVSENSREHEPFIRKLVRQSQIVQSVMRDCQYGVSHLLPVGNLLVQRPKIAYNYCLSRWF